MSDHASQPATSGQAYDALAATYAAAIETNLYNAQYERPATLSLLPDLHGLRVLDAGCGPGVYAELLLERGAEVLALDASAEMVRLAGQRLGDRATVRQADLGQPLDFLVDACFDLVLSPLAIDYVQDWGALFREFYRILRAPGTLVFSIDHPMFDVEEFASENYFATEAVSVEYQSLGPVRVPTFRRPLSAAINPLLEAGFALDRLLEPQPSEAFRQADPARYARLLLRPTFLCVRARKDAR